MDKYDAAKGVGLSLVGSAVKSANAILVRFAGKNGFDAFELILARSLFQVKRKVYFCFLWPQQQVTWNVLQQNLVPSRMSQA